jgi:hypothetical protein
MASVKSKIIGIIEIDPNTWQRDGQQALILYDSLRLESPSKHHSAPAPPTAQLEADLSSLYSELNDELTALNNRLQSAISSVSL